MLGISVEKYRQAIQGVKAEGYTVISVLLAHGHSVTPRAVTAPLKRQRKDGLVISGATIPSSSFRPSTLTSGQPGALRNRRNQREAFFSTFS